MPIVRTEHLSKTYRTGGKIEVRALDDVNLEIEAGSFISIMGPSGSGKSTLLNLLGCLDRPTSGEIFIEGRGTAKLSSAELTRIRREKVGFVFQSFNLIPTLTALENVMLPLRYEKSPNPKVTATEALQQVGLEERLELQVERAFRRRAAAGRHRPRPGAETGHHPRG